MNSASATPAHARKTVRIGGASAFWGDSAVGAPQLVRKGQVDFLVFDYLAELTMSILAGARLKNPAMGYATDFVDVAMRSVLMDVVKQGIRVVSNAGGVNRGKTETASAWRPFLFSKESEMNKRENALAWMRIAGYHDDRRKFTRLLIENRVKKEDADAAFATGQRLKAGGMACACPDCKRPV